MEEVGGGGEGVGEEEVASRVVEVWLFFCQRKGRRERESRRITRLPTLRRHKGGQKEKKNKEQQMRKATPTWGKGVSSQNQGAGRGKRGRGGGRGRGDKE